MIPSGNHTAAKGNAQFQIMMNNQARMELAFGSNDLSVFELHEADKALMLDNVQLALKAKIQEKLEEERQKWLEGATAEDFGILSLY